MQNSDQPYNCPVDATLALIGGKYKALILWHLIDRTLRFGELRRMIPQATPKMLTQQLRELEIHHLITRTVYPVVPPKVEYALTDFGKSIRPILLVMYDWGTDYIRQQGLEVNCSMGDPHIKQNAPCVACHAGKVDVEPSA